MPMRSYRLLLSVLSLLSASWLSGQTDSPRWQNLDGIVDRFAFPPDRSGTIHAGAQTGLLLHTTDTGRTWRHSNLRVDGPIDGLIALAGDTLYASSAGAPASIFRSDDAGETWTRLVADSPGFRHGLQRVSDRVFIAGSTGDLHYLSRDGVLSLDTIRRAGTLIAPGDGTLVAIASLADGAFGPISRSDDLGATWIVVSDAPSGGGPDYAAASLSGMRVFARDARRFALFFAPELPLLVTTDGGASFTSATFADGRYVSSVAWLNDSTLVGYGGNRVGYRSTDSGQTFVPDASLNPTDSELFNNITIGAAPDGPQIATRGQELYTRGADRGAWRVSRAYFSRAFIGGIVPADEFTVYLRYDRFEVPGLVKGYKSTDGGASWKPLNLLAPVPVYAPSELVVFGVDGRRIMRSTDAGLSFREVASARSAAQRFQHVLPTGANALLALGTEAPYRSTDGGSTWVELAGANPGTSLGLIDADAYGDGTTVVVGRDTSRASGGGQVHVSRDGGRTWRRLTTLPAGYRPGEIAITARGDLYMAPSLVSRDTGRTWIDLSPLPDFGGNPYSTVAFRTPANGIFSYEDCSTTTVDAGRTWTFRCGRQGFNLDARAYAFASADVGYAVGNAIYYLDTDVWPTDRLPTATLSGGAERGPGLAVRLSPNPARPGQRVALWGEPGAGTAVELYDLHGRRWGSCPIDGAGFELPIGAPAGVYVVVDAARRWRSKLVVQ